MLYRLLFPAGALLLAACSAPDYPAAEAPAAAPAAPASLPDTVAGYAFLRQTIRLTFADAPDVRGNDGAFFSRYPYPLDERVASKLAPADTTGKYLVIGGFRHTPAAVLRAFRQQILGLDPARLGQFVFIDSAGATLRPELARQVRLVGPARQRHLRQEISEWNRSPVADRFYSYASLPLFSADGRYALIVRGQAQQSIGWDSIFIYERTATGWKIRDSAQLSTI